MDNEKKGVLIMLCIRRLEGESIVIDGNIEVKVYDISHLGGNKQVKLAITAPRSISVHRKEIQEAIDKENQHKEMLV